MRKAKRLNELIQSATVRWTLTVTWTALTASLLLSPSGSGTPVSFISQLFGGTDTSDAIGHVVVITILALLWCWTIGLYANTAQTTYLILIGGIVWGLGAELSQYFVPERGTSLLDLGANILGVLIGLVVYRLLIAFVRYGAAS